MKDISTMSESELAQQSELAAAATRVPPGWALVPISPDENMIVAGMEADIAGLPSMEDGWHAISIYSAMLKATPLHVPPACLTDAAILADAAEHLMNLMHMDPQDFDTPYGWAYESLYRKIQNYSNATKGTLK